MLYSGIHMATVCVNGFNPTREDHWTESNASALWLTSVEIIKDFLHKAWR